MIFPPPQVVFGLLLLSTAVVLIFDIRYSSFVNIDIIIITTILTTLVIFFKIIAVITGQLISRYEFLKDIELVLEVAVQVMQPHMD